jgi:endonuclease YncB( thermonuclease family)
MVSHVRFRPLFAALVALMLGVAAPGFAEISGTARIFDGDTLEIGLLRIRLHGIDAPEIDQTCGTADGGEWRCGKAAADRLAALAGAGEMTCEALERDHFGRLIATCEVAGRDLARQMVGEGLAWAYTQFSDDYVDVEARARTGGRGIWQGPADAAWDYRANAWQRASGAAPREGCPIKGNINRKGERIYHTPWSAYYARTRINEGMGEAWFCNEAEAEAAGWRPAAGR